ncbi:MAG: ABC transporter ATP-binding protein [Firmicutes bacterium]|nr:ABC transporter ATP-binding protein [Bacillota bacterium]MCL2256215.1 ABC transporter ATP-binding protein [Bacillota bacterium]
MININDISKRYGDFFALENISLQVDEGEFLAIVGASGSGKSTLLNIIGQIEKPTAGDILVENISTISLSEKERAQLRNSTFGYIFQQFYLEPLYSLFKNIEIPLIIAGEKKSIRHEKIHEALKMVGLHEKSKQVSATLSGGEKQRAAIARALVTNPKIVLADEPCGNLDSKNTEIILGHLKEINNSGKTVLMVTHNMDDISYATRTIKLVDGKVE